MDILKLNKISNLVNDVFDEKYTLTDESTNPTAILVRSFDMKTNYTLPESVVAIGRAGAGVNNIPIDDYAKKGVAVFNTPGANANAVKELVIAGLLLASRDIVGGINFVKETGAVEDIAKVCEKNKSKFAGNEIYSKTIGIVGLGAIGRKVAEACINLGMKVIGYDPFLNDTIKSLLPQSVKTVDSLDKLYAKSDFITLHIPYNDKTKNTINEQAISKMKSGVKILNFARGELVDNTALLNNIGSKISKYVTDFANPQITNKNNIIVLPHLGASTNEAEDNCALMASNELKDFIEFGNIKNSVNYPNIKLDKNGKNRLTVSFIAKEDVQNNIFKLVTENINVTGSSTAIRGEYGYSIFDTNDDLTALQNALLKVDNITKVRVI